MVPNRKCKGLSASFAWIGRSLSSKQLGRATARPPVGTPLHAQTLGFSRTKTLVIVV